MEPMISDDEREQIRRESLRAFVVYLTNGMQVPVEAHSHNAGQDGGVGHLAFTTIAPNGAPAISRTFNVGVWVDVKEVTSQEVQERIAAHSAEIRRRHVAEDAAVRHRIFQRRRFQKKHGTSRPRKHDIQ